MRRRFLALGAAVVLLAAACSSGRHSAASTTTAPAHAVAGSPDPDVVPAVITPAYVNAVFAVLNHINGDAVRAMLAAKAVTPTVKRDLRAIFNDPLYAEEVKIFEESLGPESPNVRQPPGDRLTTVLRLISATRACIFVATSTDLSAVLIHSPAPAASEYYGLRLKQAGNDPQSVNPTPWALSFNATYRTARTIPDQCPA